jgi:hypothetical protein
LKAEGWNQPSAFFFAPGFGRKPSRRAWSPPAGKLPRSIPRRAAKPAGTRRFPPEPTLGARLHPGPVCRSQIFFLTLWFHGCIFIPRPCSSHDVSTKNQANKLLAVFSQGKFFTQQFKTGFRQDHDLTTKRVFNFKNIFQEYF